MMLFTKFFCACNFWLEEKCTPKIFIVSFVKSIYLIPETAIWTPFREPLFLKKIIHRTRLRNYYQTLFWKNKTKFISGWIVLSFTQFAFIVYKVDDYGNILKLSCGPLASLTSYKAFLNKRKRSGTSFLASFFGWF